MDSRHWIPEFLTVKLGFRISIISGIPDSLSCIPNSKAQESGFYNSNFQIQDFNSRAKTSWIALITVHGANSTVQENLWMFALT